MSDVAVVGNDNFQAEVLEATEPVIVDFYAEWCPPCRAVAPLLDRAAQNYAGQIKIVKCDTDRYQELSESFGVGKIPNLMFFKNGQVVDQAVGYISEALLTQKIHNLLAQ